MEQIEDYPQAPDEIPVAPDQTAIPEVEGEA